jgi:hypothetical protein
MQERSLHAALREWYVRPGDRLEVEVDGYLVDIVRGEMLIEIQTGNFSSIKEKLADLTRRHPVRLVYPIAQEKWIIRLAANGLAELSRRKSPRRGHLLHLFDELVSVSHLLSDRNFSLEVLMIREEEVRRHHPSGGWRRRGWGRYDRRLLTVLGRVRLETPSDFVNLLPSCLEQPFTTAELGRAVRQSRSLAQKMAYCLRKMGVLHAVGKRVNALLYSTREQGVKK